MIVEVCKVPPEWENDGKPFEMVRVVGCADCKAQDDGLVAIMGSERWRLRQVETREGIE